MLRVNSEYAVGSPERQNVFNYINEFEDPEPFMTTRNQIYLAVAIALAILLIITIARL
jgi:hypothetical protein